MRQINPTTAQDDEHQPAVTTTDNEFKDAGSSPTPSCSTGHEAQWAGEQKAFRAGQVLGQVLRGLASGTARSISDHVIDLIISD